VLSVKPVAANDARIGGLRDLAPLPRSPLLPWWIAVVTLGAVLCWVAGWWLDRGPDSLPGSRLAGPRSPVPLGIVLLLDESGSFADYAAIREQVLGQLTDWAPENLRPDDRVTVIGFAGTAAPRLATTTVAGLAAGGPRHLSATLAGGTSIQPALSAAAGHADTTRPTSVIAVTDTIVEDANTDAIADLVSDLNATSMTTIVPSGLDVRADWEQAFPWGLVLEADPASAEDTALAVGRALAHATGQDLEEVDR
jgi:hypothetical protein